MKYAIKMLLWRNNRVYDRLLFTMLQQHTQWVLSLWDSIVNLSLRPTTANPSIESVACRCDTVQIQTSGELNLLSALVIMMKLSKWMMTHHSNGKCRWSSLKAVHQEQLGPLTSVGTKPRGGKGMVFHRIELNVKGYHMQGEKWRMWKSTGLNRQVSTCYTDL